MSSVLLRKSLRPNYACTECLKTYDRPLLLEQHQRSHTGERPFSCDHCEKLFLRKSHLQAHMLSHTTNEDKPYHCSVCGKGVNSVQHLKRHEVTHTKSFQCEHCEEKFYKHQLLRHHVRLVHEKLLLCKVCLKAFSRPNRLAQHMLKYHGNAPLYQCDHPGCFKNHSTWSALQLHVKQDHPKLICGICQRKCVGKRGLDNHMLTHNENTLRKVWKCIYCLAEYTKKQPLLEHYHLVHDGNVPQDLLKPAEREQLLEQLLGPMFSGLPLEEEDAGSLDIFDRGPSTLMRLDRLALKFSDKMMKNTLIVALMTDNYSSQKLNCPKPKCDRQFTRNYDLLRHLSWHETQLQRVETFLQGLEREEAQAKRPRVDEEDVELDALIDEELKQCTAGCTG